MKALFTLAYDSFFFLMYDSSQTYDSSVYPRVWQLCSLVYDSSVYPGVWRLVSLVYDSLVSVIYGYMPSLLPWCTTVFYPGWWQLPVTLVCDVYPGVCQRCLPWFMTAFFPWCMTPLFTLVYVSFASLVYVSFASLVYDSFASLVYDSFASLVYDSFA